MTKIHCPDCATGTLRKLSDEELLHMFPTCRAADCVRRPEITRDHIWISPKTGYMHETWGKPKRIGVYCDKCGHFHDMDERSWNQAKNQHNKVVAPKSYKIKGYGNYHR